MKVTFSYSFTSMVYFQTLSFCHPSKWRMVPQDIFTFTYLPLFGVWLSVFSYGFRVIFYFIFHELAVHNPLLVFLNGLFSYWFLSVACRKVRLFLHMVNIFSEFVIFWLTVWFTMHGCGTFWWLFAFLSW